MYFAVGPRRTPAAVCYWDLSPFPLIPCGEAALFEAEVVGFARIEIDSVVISGTPNGIWLHGLWDG